MPNVLAFELTSVIGLFWELSTIVYTMSFVWLQVHLNQLFYRVVCLKIFPNFSANYLEGNNIIISDVYLLTYWKSELFIQ